VSRGRNVGVQSVRWRADVLPAMPTPPDPNNSNGHRTNRAGDSPAALYADVDHLTSLLAQIGSLAEGSLKCVDQAKRSLAADALFDATHGAEIERELSGAAESLERMAELVHAAMQNSAQSIGSPQLSRARPVTLGEALQHAVEVLGKRARERMTEVAVTLAPGVGALPAGAMYTVILNGLQNALESISRRGGNGKVEVAVRHDAAPSGRGYGRDTRDWYVLEITDDGAGPPEGPDLSRVFNLGYTTKPRGAGVGLAVARSVVNGMGGTIELLPRKDEAGATRGAVLRARFPAPINSSNLTLGGAA
jgi:signal transduction histidine kinase